MRIQTIKELSKNDAYINPFIHHALESIKQEAFRDIITPINGDLNFRRCNIRGFITDTRFTIYRYKQVEYVTIHDIINQIHLCETGGES